jgi:tRNA modification GTPase
MSENFACRLTAPIPSAIATIAIRGENSLSILGKCLNKVLSESQWTVGRIRFAKWPIQGSYEHVVACRVDNQTLEIHCHGGVAVSNAILEALRIHGCTIVDQSAWTNIAMESTASDPAQRIKCLCHQALLQTTSERAAGVLLDQANGALHSLFVKLDLLITTHQWHSAQSLIESVSPWNELGLHLVDPWRVVLAGPPNVGKSSLINALSGQSLAIVHHEAGTTRDWIEARTHIDGWPISLTDTAGMRQTDEAIEREGVLRATERICQADLVVVVVDYSVGWTPQHDQILKLCRQREPNPRVLIAWNKCDLMPRSLHSSCPQPETGHSYPTVTCSAQREISPLLESISRALVPEPPGGGQPIAFDLRHQRMLAEMLGRLQSSVAPDSASQLKSLSQQLFFGQFPNLS